MCAIRLRGLTGIYGNDYEDIWERLRGLTLTNIWGLRGLMLTSGNSIELTVPGVFTE